MRYDAGNRPAHRHDGTCRGRDGETREDCRVQTLRRSSSDGRHGHGGHHSPSGGLGRCSYAALSDCPPPASPFQLRTRERRSECRGRRRRRRRLRRRRRRRRGSERQAKKREAQIDGEGWRIAAAARPAQPSSDNEVVLRRRKDGRAGSGAKRRRTCPRAFHGTAARRVEQSQHSTS